ncbi:AEC family transporter [Parablautia muri]|uniref:AEC family transporter n=1 Tax=Parablautia muri TaxID=2320879 RepID=A0A9X5BJE1_9FIRM|nr:AEC family transporter [Parablautia muri]NBJ94851.1 AEC family transporter [Parablautia muri]
MLLLQQMLVLFILMAIGYFCYKKSVITDEVSKKLSAIVVNIANPALVLTGCMGEEKMQGSELVQTLMIVVVMYAALLVLALFLPLLLQVEKRSQGTYRAMTVFSNIGFMGFPVISALYGNGALLYASLFMIPYNVLIYTYGISAISTEKKLQEKTVEKYALLGKVLNVGVVACLVSMIIYFFNIPLPDFVKTTVTNLSNLTAPLSMMIIGASLATIDLKKLFADGRLLLFSLIKLVIVPVLGVLLIRRFVSNEIICGVCMVMLATPVGSMTAMLAQQYDGDYEMASKGVALTTILSVATIPLVAAIVM